jgi:hypothetical protein
MRLRETDARWTSTAPTSPTGRPGFSTSSDLAIFLMLEEQIDPSSAERIAAMTVARAREQGVEASGITQDLIDAAALLVLGRELKVEFEAISRYLAPRRFVERAALQGGSGPGGDAGVLGPRPESGRESESECEDGRRTSTRLRTRTSYTVKL